MYSYTVLTARDPEARAAALRRYAKHAQIERLREEWEQEDRALSEAQARSERLSNYETETERD